MFFFWLDIGNLFEKVWFGVEFEVDFFEVDVEFGDLGVGYVDGDS